MKGWPEIPVTTVGALIERADGKILLVRTQQWGDGLGIPGGRVNYGERLEVALRREVKEKTGLEPEPPTSPQTRTPRITGGVLAAESRPLFEKYVCGREGTKEAAYGEQLLSLTRAAFVPPILQPWQSPREGLV